MAYAAPFPAVGRRALLLAEEPTPGYGFAHASLRALVRSSDSHCGVFMGDRLLATVISQQYLYMRENFTYNLPTKTYILAAVVHTEVAAVPVTVDCFG